MFRKTLYKGPCQGLYKPRPFQDFMEDQGWDLVRQTSGKAADSEISHYDGMFIVRFYVHPEEDASLWYQGSTRENPWKSEAEALGFGDISEILGIEGAMRQAHASLEEDVPNIRSERVFV